MLSIALSLFFVVSELNGEAVAHAAERRRLHLPVVDGVFEQADAIIESPLHPKPSRAEVVHAHVTDVVGVEVDHLKKKKGGREKKVRMEGVARFKQLESEAN